MMILLEGVLSAEQVQRLRADLEACQWRNGQETAGADARDVKSNLQAVGQDTLPLADTVTKALVSHDVFSLAAMPKRFSGVLFSRYRPGMAYGPHTDDTLMGAGADRLRADIAFTVFLSEPETYIGGSLIIESAAGEQAIKLQAGDAIVYPAGSVHRVEPVTGGERWAAVGWLQSCVRFQSQREILFDLATARARLSASGAARDDILLLQKSIGGLLRLWADL